MTIYEKQKKLLEVYDLKVGDVIDFYLFNETKTKQERLKVILDDGYYYLKNEENNSLWSIDKLVYHDWGRIGLPQKSYTVKDILNDIRERINNPQYYDKNEIEKDIDILEFALEKIKDQIVELNKLKVKEENK